MQSRAVSVFRIGIRLTCAALVASLLAWSSLQASSHDYVVLQVPGCGSTIPWAVNDRGDVVGSASSCAGAVTEFAFLYRGGAYYTIDVPGAILTLPSAINDRGTIAGYFYTPQHELRAFTYWKGQHETIGVSGVDLVPQGINSRGDITGWLPTVPYQAFLLEKNGDFTILPFPGDTEGLQAWGINSSGAIVGSGYSPTLGSVSFVYRRGESTIAALPGLYYAVNDRGDVAAEVPGSGFVIYRDGAPLALNHPETDYTIFDISNGWVVGAIGGGRGYMLRLP
jgi:uncharacterized membrane protein